MNVNEWHMRNERKCDGINENDVLFSNDTGILGTKKKREKKFRVLPTGVEPATFRLPVRTLYH